MEALPGEVRRGVFVRVVRSVCAQYESGRSAAMAGTRWCGIRFVRLVLPGAGW